MKRTSPPSGHEGLVPDQPAVSYTEKIETIPNDWENNELMEYGLGGKQGVLTPERGPDRGPVSKLGEISNEEAAVVAGLAAYANAVRKARRYDPTRSIYHVGEGSSRSAITARGNVTLVVHSHDSATVVVDVC